MFTTSTSSAAPTPVPVPVSDARTSASSAVSSPPPPPPALALSLPDDTPTARRVTSKSSLRSLRSLASSLNDDENTDPDPDHANSLDPEAADKSLIRPSILRRLSPGLAARVKLLDGNNKHTAHGRNPGAVGRIPEEHIKELDSQHQDLSIRILKKGRAWHGLHLSSKDKQRQTSADYEELEPPDLVQEQSVESEPPTSVPDSSAPVEQPDPTPVDTTSAVPDGVPDEATDSPATMSAADPLPAPSVPQPAMESPANEETDFEKYVKDTRDSEAMPPPPPPKDGARPISSSSAQISAFFTQRPPSLYSFGSFRVSLLNQVAQLTSIPLPQPSAFQASIKNLPTAPVAVKAIVGAGENVQRWIQKAVVVLGGMEVDDEVEWAAAGGREALAEIDQAITNFDGLINVYVKVIEIVQAREDIADASSESLETVVGHMDMVLQNWGKVKSKLREIKGHVELAMEWEELWDTVFGDVETEVDQLAQLLFDVQSKRHAVMSDGPQDSSHNNLDISELETIVEETPSSGGAPADKLLNVGSIFAAAPTVDAPIIQTPQDGGHGDLIAVFARLQPLKASIQFLPMRLSMFESRAAKIYPTACADINERRLALEENFKSLETDAETLRKELSEDRWILVFRNAGGQAQKMFESVERSIVKLQDSIEQGVHLHNPGAIAKRVESYEAKKHHYIPAIARVITVIEKGVQDRLTLNGETLTLMKDMQNKMDALKASINVMDTSIADLNLMSSQQLRDSISTIITMDSPANGSVVDTPASSPASSVIVTPANAHKGATTPLGSSSRRGSSVSSAARSTFSKVRRYSGLPQPSATKKSAIPKLVAPSPAKPNTATTPTPAARRGPPRPSSALDGRPRWNLSTNTNDLNSDYRKPAPAIVDKRPRWNSSTNTNDLEVGHTYRSSLSPSPFRKFSESRMSRPSSTLPGMSRRDHSPSPAPSASRISSRLGSRSPAPGRMASPAPRSILDPPPYSKLRRPAATPQDLPKTPRNRQSYAGASFSRSVSQEAKALFTPKSARPGTALGHSGSRRISLLPLPSSQSGRDSAAGNRPSSKLSQRPPWR